MDKKYFRLFIPAELHDGVRIVAAAEGKTMHDFIVDSVTSRVSNKQIMKAITIKLNKVRKFNDIATASHAKEVIR